MLLDTDTYKEMKCSKDFIFSKKIIQSRKRDRVNICIRTIHQYKP
jgi:hypothetical protein